MPCVCCAKDEPSYVPFSHRGRILAEVCWCRRDISARPDKGCSIIFPVRTCTRFTRSRFACASSFPTSVSAPPR